MGKYSDIPVEKREEHRWNDMGEYFDGKITLDELNAREQGSARHTKSFSSSRGHGKKGDRPKNGLSFK